MTYVVEAGSSRRSRRRRAGITLLVVVLMLFFAFWYAYSYYRSDGAESAAPTTCPTVTATPTGTATAAPPLPSKTIVNVYNSTNRTGLAAKAAAAVRKRGFVVEEIANDPLKKSVQVSAHVRYGPKGKEKARLVVALVAGSKAVPDKRADDSVDLVLGVKFKALAPEPAATPTTPAPRCAP